MSEQNKPMLCMCDSWSCNQGRNCKLADRESAITLPGDLPERQGEDERGIPGTGLAMAVMIVTVCVLCVWFLVAAVDVIKGLL